MERIFFTSDTHFCHRRIIEMCQRPFENVEQMEDVLVDNWNQVVRRHDTVYHLGDFCLGSKTDWKRILNRLHGKIHLIVGNHDWNHLCPEVECLFEEVTVQKLLRRDDVNIYLNHYPFLYYSGSSRGDVWQCFGHVHSGRGSCGNADVERLKFLLPTQYDVGVDNNEYAPVEICDLRQIIRKQMGRG